MEILSGLFDQIVLQRDKRNQSDALLTGRCGASGPVLARVTQNGKPVRGLSGAAIGSAKGGKFTARLRGLPAGGPYEVNLSVGAETLAVGGVLVGDVWLVGGQSNAQGCGRAVDRAKPHPRVRAFYMDDHWAVAEDPIHQLEIAVDAFHNGGIRAAKPGKNFNGVGPAVMFGKEMLRSTGVPQGLIACAHGGTSMTQWDPALKKTGGKSLYGATFRRLKKNGGKVAGVIWYQGESDANPDAAPLFTPRMKKLVAAFRRDAGDPKLPFVQVQISRVVGWEDGSNWNAIQDQQRRLDGKIKNLATVPAIDLTLDDMIHISGVGQQVLGKRMAQAMSVLRQGRRAGKPVIALKSVSVATEPIHNLANVTVEFDHVAGALTAGGRPTGFVLVDSHPRAAIFDTNLEGNRVILRTALTREGINGLKLHYGYGTNPVCNITDRSNRSLPVFGPILLGDSFRALMPHIQTMRVSPPLPSAGKLQSLRRLPSKVAWRKIDFPSRFCDMHLELGKLAPKDVLILFAFQIDCSEKMKLQALLGYDGPVKLFVDGKARFHNPAGTNPASEDMNKIPFVAGKGRHEIVVALASNQGKAWGIYCRLERLGIPKRLLSKGPTAYAMPRVVG